MNDPSSLIKPSVTREKEPEKSPIVVFHQTEDSANMMKIKPLICHPIPKKIHVPSQIKNVMTESVDTVNVTPENDDTVINDTEKAATENMISSKVSEEEAHIHFHSHIVIKEEYIETCDQNLEEISTLYETL